MHVERLDHLVLAVDDLAPALEAWRAVFDIDATAPEQPAGTHMELAALRPENAGDGGAFLELVRATTDSHRVARFVAGVGEGMFSVSVEVDDIDATVAELRAKGLDVSSPEPGVLPNTRIARIPRAAAHGVAVQFIQR